MYTYIHTCIHADNDNDDRSNDSKAKDDDSDNDDTDDTENDSHVKWVCMYVCFSIRMYVYVLLPEATEAVIARLRIIITKRRYRRH